MDRRKEEEPLRPFQYRADVLFGSTRLHKPVADAHQSYFPFFFRRRRMLDDLQQRDPAGGRKPKGAAISVV